MTAFTTRETDKIDIAEGEYIEIKRRMSVGDYDHIDWLMNNANIGHTMALIETNVVSWNLKNDKGEVLPVTRENISALEYIVSHTLLLEIGKRNKQSKKE